ncbi:MAG TPA: hypothetical protein VHI93_05125 [Candidatus Thermoplasmatota archaeon]|nr:hypothetical protein [Candidatus Thermoplasmatota archaeon]
MAFLRPDDGPEVVYEFFAPFAHVPGRYEWCRIRSPTHGVLDAFIVLGASTAVPATVYVNSAAGRAFMAHRYPECRTVHVPPSGLLLSEAPDGRHLTGTLVADGGPVRRASMEFRALGTALPRQVPYGGEGTPVWGSRFTCWGVDLVLDAACDGRVELEDGTHETLRAAPAVLTLGSFGRIAPRVPQPTVSTSL